MISLTQKFGEFSNGNIFLGQPMINNWLYEKDPDMNMLHNFISFYRYGDRSPKSILARIFCIFWILCGIILVSLFTGLVTAALSISATPVYNIPGAKVGYKFPLAFRIKQIEVYKYSVRRLIYNYHHQETWHSTLTTTYKVIDLFLLIIQYLISGIQREFCIKDNFCRPPRVSLQILFWALYLRSCHSLLIYFSCNKIFIRFQIAIENFLLCVCYGLIK